MSNASILESLGGENVQVGFLSLHVVHVFVGKVLEELEPMEIVDIDGAHGNHALLSCVLVGESRALHIGVLHMGALVAVAMSWCCVVARHTRCRGVHAEKAAGAPR